MFPEAAPARSACRRRVSAIGVTGDTEDRDEELAAHGIHAAGLKTDDDCKDLGRSAGIRLTKK
jgi:hypothetical protein